MADYFNTLNGIAKELKRELILWADHITGHSVEPDLLEHLDKDIILHDWNYWDQDPTIIRKRLEKATNIGMRVIGGPAWGWCRWVSRPGREQLNNINGYADACKKLDTDQVLGVITTNWCPYRYLPDAIWDGIAYAGVAMEHGVQVAVAEAFKMFVEKHFSARYTDDWAEVFAQLYL